LSPHQKISMLGMAVVSLVKRPGGLMGRS